MPYFSIAGRSIPHAKGKAGIFIRIDIAVRKYIRMHHAATQDFYPTCFLTDITTAAAADKTAYIHFSAGFGKRKIRRPETYLNIFPVHFFYKKYKVCLRSANETFSSIYNPFYLVKEAMAPRAYGFIPVYTAGTYNPDG